MTNEFHLHFFLYIHDTWERQRINGNNLQYGIKF